MPHHGVPVSRMTSTRDANFLAGAGCFLRAQEGPSTGLLRVGDWASFLTCASSPYCHPRRCRRPFRLRLRLHVTCARLGQLARPWYCPQVRWPDWWEWELELTPHVERRMEIRDFSEVSLRDMLQCAVGYRPDFVEGRYLIETTFRNRRWEVIVEPDEIDHLLVVVTAYKVES